MLELKMPWLRRELLRTLRILSDPERQQRVWVDLAAPRPAIYDDFPHAVAFLIDDTELVTEPRGQIGFVLRNTDEAMALTKLGEALGSVLRAAPENASDEDIISMPRWITIVTLAEQIRNQCLANDGPAAREFDSEELLPGNPYQYRDELRAWLNEAMRYLQPLPDDRLDPRFDLLFFRRRYEWLSGPQRTFVAETLISWMLSPRPNQEGAMLILDALHVTEALPRLEGLVRIHRSTAAPTPPLPSLNALLRDLSEPDELME